MWYIISFVHSILIYLSIKSSELIIRMILPWIKQYFNAYYLDDKFNGNMYYVSIDYMLMCVLSVGRIIYFLYPSINHLLFRERDIIATFLANYHYSKGIFKFLGSLLQSNNGNILIYYILYQFACCWITCMVSGYLLILESQMYQLMH